MHVSVRDLILLRDAWQLEKRLGREQNESHELVVAHDSVGIIVKVLMVLLSPASNLYPCCISCLGSFIDI